MRIVGSTEGADPFGTGTLRRLVLETWAASPARFREDANAEEELALGGYRDRLVVELAQNAADAAVRAGVPGRLRLTLRDGVLAVANTGAPLDAVGVQSLATLRASAKRDDASSAVGRFGVGFAAVLSVSDEPAVLSRTGGVRWSLGEARRLAEEAAARDSAEHGGLGEELRRRDGHVPVLRLPFPAEGAPPAGYDTVVVLPLRDASAGDLARRLLAEVDDALLLTLPGLAEVVVEDTAGTRTLTRRTTGPGEPADAGDRPQLVVVGDARDGAPAAESRWQVVTAAGRLDDALLAHRPVEERGRPHWSVTWAVPVDEAGRPEPPRTPPVVHAPTPSDDPLGVPALLIATLPLDSTRRRIAPGPLTEHLLDRAADTYAALLRRRGPDRSSLALVPGPLGSGELDAGLRRRILERLADTPFLPAAASAVAGDRGGAGGGAGDRAGAEDADGGAGSLRPREAVLLEGADAEVVGALADVLPGLLPAGLERRSELRTLGVRRLPLAEVVDQLGGLDREPAWWRNLYAALTGAASEALGGLPVPLADGRLVTGPRRVLLPAPDADWDGDPAADLARLGLRLAHPEAAHPLLEKLGARTAGPVGVLESPELRAAVERSARLAEEDQEEAEELADAVLRVVRAAGVSAASGELPYPWLARLALTDEDGEPAAAGELVLPGGPLAAVLDEDDTAFVAPEWLDRWGPEVLAAVGVADRPVLLRAHEAVLDPDDLDRLDPTVPPDRAAGGEPTGLIDEAPDGLAEWAEDTLDLLHAARRPDDSADLGGIPPVAAELLAVRDLDLVDDDAWPQALALLAVPPLRDAVTLPVRLRLPDGGTADVPPYTAWWLRDHPVLDGRRPGGLRAAGGDRLLRGLYEPARTDLDEEFLHALGVRTTLAALLAEPDGPDEVLERLADPERPVGHRQLHGICTALAAVPLDRVPVPDEVRALPPMAEGTRRRPEGTVVVPAADAVIADAPDLMQLLDGFPVVPVAPGLAAELAERLHVSLASEVAGGRVLTEGTVHRVPEAVRELLPGCPEFYEEHEELLVVGPDGAEAPVDWRWDPDGAAPVPTDVGGADEDNAAEGAAAEDAGDAREAGDVREAGEARDAHEADGARDAREADGAGEAADGAAAVPEFVNEATPGALHAATPEGLAAGLAWASGHWPRRFEVLAVLSDPERAYELSAARDFEG